MSNNIVVEPVDEGHTGDQLDNRINNCSLQKLRRYDSLDLESGQVPAGHHTLATKVY
ncbi:potassium transporter 5 [Corchorus olitorius]|uniref:Potassium transporter 5 n=1 Tax=Corchorus olitorius TaxID=93759 RepID=A0A1R3JVF8_9ROSI|nr:potassium transporter 5 [Corchorus olitorius]